MYRSTLVDHFGYPIAKVDTYLPLDEDGIEALRAVGPEGSFVDVCRLEDDGLSDTANFRDIVEAELEPFETGE